MTRRLLLTWQLCGVLATVCLGVCDRTVRAIDAAAPDRPNIVWLTSEDNGPHMGCYGDAQAVTPNLDALARQGIIFSRCWSNAPVCAPARTTIITGMYPTSLGAEHMRSMVPLPPGVKLFPQYLREIGYYCTNNRKEDYNVPKPGKVWDVSSGRAHWKHRPDGAPFFAVFNSTISHESKLRMRPHTLVHDPSKIHVPAYHPDTPEVRHDWAQYYDKITEMDAALGKRLKELERAGRMDDTIIFYFGDHGSGMPRSKRCPYNSGLQVPLILYIPPKFAHLRPADYKEGGVSRRLVSFVDLAPTMLSLCGIEPPETMQGKAFLGKFAAPPRKYLFGYRGRMDERYDLIRTVTDGRFVYVRNFMPHKPLGQYIDYMFQTPTTKVWYERFQRGELNDVQSRFWQKKPAEELYDLDADPDETRNLASDPKFAEVRSRLSRVLRAWMLEVRDVGLLPEGEMHARRGESSPYELGHDRANYPLERILRAAEIATAPGAAGDGDAHDADLLLPLLEDSDAAVRYWGLVGLEVRGAGAAKSAQRTIRALLEDSSWSVRVAAAKLAVMHGGESDRAAGLACLLEGADQSKHGLFVAIAALNAIDELGSRAASIVPKLKQLPRTDPNLPRRINGYVPRLLDRITNRM